MSNITANSLIQCTLLANHCQELLFIDDGHSEFGCFLQLGRAHVVASQHVVGLLGNRAHVAAAVLLDWLVLYVAAGYSLTLYALVTKYLPIYFYTLLTIPVCYGLQAWVRKPRVRSAIRRRRSKLHKLQ